MEYLRKQTDAQLAEQFIPILEEKGVEVAKYPFAFVEQLCGLIKERAHFVADFWDICSYFFIAPTAYAENDVKKFCTPETMEIIEKVKAFIAAMDIKEFATAGDTPKAECVHAIEEKLTGYIKENEWKMGAVMNTLRLFFVGQAKGLGIADIIYFVGKEEALRRIEAGQQAV